MNKGKTFLLRLTVIGLTLVILDLAIGKLMEYFYFHLRHGEQARLTYAIDSTADPILVLGSSRAAHQYVPAIITDSLHLRCYNAGKDKQGLYYCLAMLEMVLPRYHPKLVILDLAPAAFISSESGLDELSVLLPYYHEHPEIGAILDKRGRWEWLKLHSALYRYNSLALQIAFNSLSISGDAGAVNGYLPRYDTLQRPPAPPYTPQQLNGPPDSNCVKTFEDLIALAKSSGCSITVAVSPMFFPLPQGTSTIRLARAICRRMQVPFLDFTNSSLFTGNKPIFNDEQHLNNAGAELFTRTLCKNIAIH
jgi:hypothetical protein